MKVAIDLDGTAFKHKNFFVELVKGLKSLGHTVGILTAHYEEQFKEEDLKIWKDMGLGNPDFYLARKGELEHSMLIGDWKWAMCMWHDIDILFDDFGGNNSNIEKTFFEGDLGKLVVFKVIPGED